MTKQPQGTPPAGGSAHQRVVVYIPPADYAQLQSVLAADGLTVSGWVRKIIRLRLSGKLR